MACGVKGGQRAKEPVCCEKSVLSAVCEKGVPGAGIPTRGILALNSRLLLEGSLKNMVFCSPARPLNRMWGSMINWARWVGVGEMPFRGHASHKASASTVMRETRPPTLTLCSRRRSARRSNPSQLRTQPKWGTGTSSPSTGLVWSSLFFGCGWTVGGVRLWGERLANREWRHQPKRSWRGLKSPQRWPTDLWMTSWWPIKL